MKALPVATFNALPTANELRSLLQAAGIKAYIHNESWVERFWFMTEPLAAIHVEVSEKNYLEARRLIEEWDKAQGVLKYAVRCPECGSSRIEFPQITRKFLMPVLQVILMTLHVMPRQFYCVDCQYTWPKEMPKQTERDIFGWPVKSRLGHSNSARDENLKRIN